MGLPSHIIRLSDEELRENGYDPTWIDVIDDPDCEHQGPYAVYCDFKAQCPRCEHTTRGWTILNIVTGTGIGSDWFGDNGQCEAEAECNKLNRAWAEGYASFEADMRSAVGFE